MYNAFEPAPKKAKLSTNFKIKYRMKPRNACFPLYVLVASATLYTANAQMEQADIYYRAERPGAWWNPNPYEGARMELSLCYCDKPSRRIRLTGGCQISRVLKKSFSEEKTCKNPNVFEGRFSKTAIFQQPVSVAELHQRVAESR
jgi:hypothetical protein